MTRRNAAVRDGLIVGLAVWVLALGLGLAQFGADAVAYWQTRNGDWYGQTYGSVGAFVYSPVIGQMFAPLVGLPWPVFEVAWALILAGALAWLRPSLRTLIVLLVPIAFELHAGNIHILLAAAIVAGFQRSAAWAFVLLTKVTPGLGLLWFAVRREWRPLAIALVATALVAGVSIWLAPQLWLDWLGYITSARQPTQPTAIPIPLAWRIGPATALLVWGAVTGRRWTVPMGAMLALPVVWIGSFSMLVAVPRLRERRVSHDGERQVAGTRERGEAGEVGVAPDVSRSAGVLFLRDRSKSTPRVPDRPEP